MKSKEPSLFKKLITIYYEQAKRRKALRLLSKQNWSVEFLTALIAKAAKQADKAITMTITNSAGVSLTITSTNASVNESIDDSIFNHLDDNAAIQDFIARNSRR